MRLTVLDGLLSFLREMRNNSMLSVISQGEGCLIHMLVFSPEARQAAYQERAVSDTERKDLEEVANNAEFAIFIAPLTLPKESLTLVKEVVPEINVVNVGVT